MRRELRGKRFGEGDIFRERFERLARKGINLITRLKRNMKTTLMEREEKLLVWKRAVIETASGFLKNIRQVEHSRRRKRSARYLKPGGFSRSKRRCPGRSPRSIEKTFVLCDKYKALSRFQNFSFGELSTICIIQ
jgi:hypothetical protein